MNRIVVGLDGSEHAARALVWAVGLGRDTAAEIVAVHVLGLLVHNDAGVPVPSDTEYDHIRELLEHEWTAPLRESEVKHRCRLEGGSPVTTLLHVAAEEDADLIVVGSRGSGGFSELHLGSTSHQVALYSDRPVTIVPPPGRSRPNGGR